MEKVNLIEDKACKILDVPQIILEVFDQSSGSLQLWDLENEEDDLGKICNQKQA